MVDSWRILYVEDDAVLAASTKRNIERRPLSTDGRLAAVDVAASFQDGVAQLEARRYDLVILDIRNDSATSFSPDADAGDEATSADVGIDLYKRIRASQFVPIIFYSAVAHLVSDLHRPPFVTVVSKTSTEDNPLRSALSAAVESRLPLLRRALEDYVEESLRVYMQGFVEVHWQQLGAAEHAHDLAHMLARRLAWMLGDGSGLERRLGDAAGLPERRADAPVHPMRMYVIPPIGDWTTGDIVYASELQPDEIGMDGDGSLPSEPSVDEPGPALEAGIVGRYWVMLTPACDLVDGRVKADYVVLAQCRTLMDELEVNEWLVSPSSSKEKKLDQLLGNNRQGRGVQPDRFHSLPPAWDVPPLLVDFQRIVHVPYGRLVQMERRATLDDPYAQELVNRFSRYIGRLGTPDLDLGRVRQRLKELGGERSDS